MTLESDVSVNVPKFQKASITEGTAKFNGQLMAIMSKGPKWYEVGAANYRKMRWNGETPLPKPVVLESGKSMEIPSREDGRGIPCRYFLPEKGNVTGVYMHIHGGGWVLGTEEFQDTMLNDMAQRAKVAVISVGYRLAPEDPFPKGPEDCYDAGEWLVDHSKEKFGADLMFMGGESAGGHLSCLTAFHLLKTRPDFQFRGLVLHFGAYDLSLLPQVYTYKKPEILVLDRDITEKYLDAFLPGISAGKRKDPSISPIYADLTKLKLPSVLLTCGTEDPLLDDTVFMGVKWQMAGGEAIVKIYPGAPHGFVIFPSEHVENAKKGMDDVIEYMESKMG